MNKYYTPHEVSQHNEAKDLWLSFLGKVYNLTEFCKINSDNILTKLLIMAAGTDISHWFDPETKSLKTFIDPKTELNLHYCQNGRVMHVEPPYPDSSWDNNFKRPWWLDLSFAIGILTKKTRQIVIVNTLTSQKHIIEVCSEETMYDILQRYLVYNSHAKSYTWKYNLVDLDMNKTLEANGVKDEDEIFYKLSIDDDLYIPSIHLYFNDDLTED
ncbi:Cytochrome b5 domain-containing protein 1 [Intoshia linei]|uniref:Cytochrome b5 domain-containing protein 1 n=1 Tax=Intoshia linei TaxID=1819745 RepID=A0A177BBW5_9BILA|nr:Cytochrome b5 domain-containing protein 1 [Intoshia linei]